MTTDENNITNEIASAFSLSKEAAQAACLLLQARARTLDFTFDEYMQRYHPQGIAKRDEGLSDRWQGYVQFLGDDATSVLRAGKGADFSTFIHECAHVFRRQLSGALREQAEKAFGTEGGLWSEEKEEQFARGLEQWIKRRRGRDKSREAVYNKGRSFVDTVYRGMERVVEIDSRMEAVYERLFEDSENKFNQGEYEKTPTQITDGTLPKKPHIFLGMTPRVYEELGFQRLPMAITTNHLYATLRAGGAIEGVNYHDLGKDILRQLPEQLKKPLCIVQSSETETDIVSIIGLTDKNGDTVIVPIAQYQKGNLNGAEIDINLVKSLYGKNEFKNWLKETVDDGRLLYINNKKTEPALRGGLESLQNYINADQSRTTRLPDGFRHSLTAGPTTDVFGFLTENVARYKETVKEKFPERFRPVGERILFKTGNQLTLDYNAPSQNFERQIEVARKAGYVQGVCECVAAVGQEHNLGKRLMTEMNVTKDMVKKYANPKTCKILEQGIFAPKQERKLTQTQGVRR